MHTQEQVTQTMGELVNTLGNNIAIFAEDGEIDISVMEGDEIEVERILDRYGISYEKNTDEWPCTNYIFKGEYNE